MRITKRDIVTISIIASLLAVFAAVFSGCIEAEMGGDTTSSYELRSDARESTSNRTPFDYRRSELDNGLEVITLEDFSTPIVTVQVWYHVGSKNEDPQRQGFAHMFEHMMFKGTDLVAEKDHFGLINKVGGTNNGYTSFDKTVYLETVPKNQVELALWLEAERMAFLDINQEHFNTERQVVEEELRMRLNQPYGTVVEKVAAQIFDTHPYSWTPIGSLEDLRAASVPELRQFWKKYYVPSNATLVIVGAIEHEKASALAEEYFGWMPRYPQPPRVKDHEPKPTEPKEIVIDDENAPAPAVGLLWRTVPAGHPDEVVLDMLSSILGGGNSSRLYRDLVANQRIAVKAMASTYNLELDGVFVAGAMESPGSSDQDTLAKRIQMHIDKIKTGGVTGQELEKARNQMLKMLVTDTLKIDTKARILGNAAVIYGKTSMANEIFERVRQVTAADIQRAANQYLVDSGVHKIFIKQNIDGPVTSPIADETAAITAKNETDPPAPGRDSIERPENYPKQPPLADIKKFDATPQYTVDTLENGLKVYTVPNREVPFVTVKLGLTFGAWTENKPGTAFMAMKMLPKGTKNMSEEQIAAELERYAVDLTSKAGMDTSEISMGFLSEYSQHAMEILADIVLNPTFDTEQFAKLSQQVLAELAVQYEDPSFIAGLEFGRQLYGEHPYSRPAHGSPEDIQKLDREDLDLWHRKFMRPDQATIIFAGDIDRQTALKLTRDNLGHWETNLVETGIILPDLPPVESTKIYIVDKPDSPQSQIRIGHYGITRRQQPEYFTSRVVCDYFSWSFNSRLNTEIRIEKGLTYGIWGCYYAHNMAGEFRINTFTKTASTAEAVAAVIDQLRNVKTDPPSPEELADSKSHIAGSFVIARETPQQVAEDLWLIESQRLQRDYLSELLASIAQTSAQDCVQLLQKTINPDKLVVVVVGDAEKIKDDLAKIAPVEVIVPSGG